MPASKRYFIRIAAPERHGYRMPRYHNKKKIKLNPKYLLIVFSVICFVLIFISYQYPEKTLPLRKAAADFVSPMQRGVNRIGKALNNRMKNFSDVNALIEENARLQEELNQLKYENKMIQQDNNEMETYRSLYQLDQKYISYPKVAARIISRDSNSLYSSFTIDKGSNDGIKVDQNVLAGNGLAGIVTEVFSDSAKVRAIIDDSSNLSGMSLRSEDTCIVSGNLQSIRDGYIDISMISMNANIEENSEIVTSHISDKYHQGILIGYAVDIKTDSSNMAKEAKLIPAVDFEHLEMVLIITELK